MTAKSFSWILVVFLLIGTAAPCWSQDPEPTLNCTIRVGAPPVVSAEGLAELTGDIIIDCIADGPVSETKYVVTDFSVALNTTITSRTFGDGISDALLFINEPDPDNWHVNPGPTTSNTVDCESSPQCPNVFVPEYRSPNRLEWNGVSVPIPASANPPNTPPRTIIRITNIRANASQLWTTYQASSGSQIQVITTTQITSRQILPPISNPTQVVAIVLPSVNFNVTNPVSFRASQGYQGRAAELRFTELFPSAFKKRNCAVTHTEPRFSDPDAGRSNLFSIDACRTNLLWPFVNDGGQFTSGVHLSPTALDPFGTSCQAGTCNLNYYGATGSGTRLNSTFKNLPPEGRFFISTQNVNAGPGHSAHLMTPGGAPAVDQGNGFTPLEQVCPDYRTTRLCTTSWQVIDNDPNVIETFVFPLDYSRPAGPAQPATVVTYATPSIGPVTNFQSYVISQCNFDFAHGFAFISDLGAQRLAEGYLSLIIPESGQRAEAETRVGAFEVRGENAQQLRPADTVVEVLSDGEQKGANTLRFNLTSEGYLPQRLVLGSFGTNRLGNFTVTVEAAGGAKGAVGDSWLKVETIGEQTPVTLVVSVDPEGLAPGAYAGSVTATPGLQGAAPVVLPVELVVPPPGPRVRTFGVTSAGSYAHSVVAPGEALVIFGVGFGPPALVGLELANGVASTNIGQTRILFDGEAAPMIYTVANQASCFVPFSVEGKKFVEVVVEYEGGASPPARVAVLPSKPALLTANASGSGIGAILTQDFTPNSQKPAKPGEFVVLFGVGGGQTIPPSVGGRLQMGIGEFKVPVRAFLDGEEVVPLYAGPAPDLVEGVFQINLPLGMNIRRNAELPVVIHFGDDLHTQPGVTVWVE